MRLAFCLAALATTGIAQSPPAWVAKSNESAQLLLNATARYSPENAGSLGVNGLDEQITVPTADRPQRIRKDLSATRAQLQQSELEHCAICDRLLRKSL